MIVDSNTCLCIRILKQIHVLRNSLVNKRFKNEDQSVTGMFCLNVSKSTNETESEGSPNF